ncbi:Acetylcholinesterase [Papilio machaon]|uniref:Carboxylic ester hydrolase n=1 Tax=Papilio machaon TaxID=76193 RepID=A0A0N1IBZ7_PAPMA|nr:Acetylcholinesterase [Papilio machaon]
MVQVRISDGILEGEVTDNKYGGKIYCFRGIPYAQPPLGDLRFKAPQPVKPWNGVRDAKKLGNECYQYNVVFSKVAKQGSEDCLYVNVFSPNLKPTKPLPVMVFIHGGGFTGGSGSDEFYGPNYLIRHDVIIVTLNYRLEILGFLCLDTEDVPGNAGMKDQVAALRWVQKNISNFGGDPNNVTIFGESAGGGSVSLHLLSPMSKGLFKRVIPQSGIATAHWATGFMVKERSLQLARELGCNSKDEKEIYEFFKALPVEALVNKHITLTYAETNKEVFIVPFSIVVEKQFGNNERFMVGEPIEILRNYGIHEGVDVMEGYTEDDGVAFLGGGKDISKMISQANKYAEFLVPQTMSIYCPLIDQMEIDMNPEIEINARLMELIDQVTKLWTNFAKYGNPTPDDSLGVIWKPYTLEGQDFLDIGENLVAGTRPDKDELEFWEQIYTKYCPKYAP